MVSLWKKHYFSTLNPKADISFKKKPKIDHVNGRKHQKF